MVHLPRSAVVVGAGAVGCATALALARRGLRVVLVEAEDELAPAVRTMGSGILRSGFDADPGTLETRLILRSAQLRDEVLDALGVPVLRCGAVMPRAPLQAAAVAGRNGVEVRVRRDGSLLVPGEAVTDPVRCTLALAAAAQAHGAQVRTGFRVRSVRRGGLVTSHADDAVVGDVVIDCAGAAAEPSSELFVFDAHLDCILLPAEDGGLLCPTIDGKAIAEAAELQGSKPIASFPVPPPSRGELIGRSASQPELIKVASSELSAALGIAEHVARLVAPGRPEAPLHPGEPPPLEGPWWNRLPA